MDESEQAGATVLGVTQPTCRDVLIIGLHSTRGLEAVEVRDVCQIMVFSEGGFLTKKKGDEFKLPVPAL